MTPLAIARTAATLAPFVAAALAAALTVRTSYDAEADELTVTVRKLRPAATALATARGLATR